MSNRAVIYARVSTDEQAEKGGSLPDQIEACNEYAISKNLEVIAEFREDYSGYEYDRPELDVIREMMDSRQFDHIIITKPDRLTRSVAHGAMLRKEFKRGKVRLHFVQLGEYIENPVNRYMMSTLDNFSEYWRDTIIENCMKGKNRKARDGKPVMSGHPPYGYLKEGKGNEARLIVNPVEAKTVQDIFYWYIYGDEGGPLSLMAIADKLHERGDSTPHYRSNAAERWIPATVRGILTNEIYAGRTYYGKTRMIDDQRVKQPREEWIPIDLPDELAIISPEIFNQVQARARRNVELAQRNKRRQYLLSGHFRCGHCNSAMAATTSVHNGYEESYYRCGNHWRRLKGEACEIYNRTIVTNKVDGLVWEWIVNLLQDDQAILDGIRGVRERKETEIEPKRRRLEIIRELIDENKKKIDRLVNRFADEEDEDLIPELKIKIKTLRQDNEKLGDEERKLLEEFSERSITPEAEAEILNFARAIREELIDPDYETKRYILDKLNVEIVYRVEGAERWLDARCYIMPDWISIGLYPSLTSSLH